MKRLILFLLAGAAATPVSAQHQGHHMPGMSMPGMTMPARKPAAKKPAAKKAPLKKAAPAKRKSIASRPAAKAAPRRDPLGQAADPHAGHAMPAMPADPHAGHRMEEADPHAGHAMPQATSDPHAGHTAKSDPHAGHGTNAPVPPVAPPPPGAFAGPAHAADSIFGPEAMGKARRQLTQEHGGMRASKLLIDQLEARIGRGRPGYFLNAEAWHGGDFDKLWLKSEVEGERGRSPDKAEFQALWSHAIDPWFDLQTGVRFDANHGPNRTHLVLGVQGLAPYWFELDGAVFLSNKGEVTMRGEAEYDLRVTQKLVLQPRLEVDLSAQRVRELGLGAGLSSAELGVRLRYQIRPEFAPYVGVNYERAFGGTRRFRKNEGQPAGDLNMVAGLRFWF